MRRLRSTKDIWKDGNMITNWKKLIGYIYLTNTLKWVRISKIVYFLDSIIFFNFSYPVWIRHHFRGRVSVSAIISVDQQCIWNTFGCLQIHYANETAYCPTSQRYWDLVQYFRRNDLLSRSIQCKYNFFKKEFWRED